MSAATPAARPAARTMNVVCVSTTRSKTVMSIPPNITPLRLPAPPRTTMQRSMIDTWNSNAPGVMAWSLAAYTEPAKPENEAPSAKARSLVEIGLTPVQSAAVSSSRMAIQARPRRESRSRFIDHSDAAPMIRIRKYQGTGSVSKGTPGRYGRPIGFTPFSPPVRFSRSIGRHPPMSTVMSPRLRIATGMISPNPSVMIAR